MAGFCISNGCFSLIQDVCGDDDIIIEPCDLFSPTSIDMGGARLNTSAAQLGAAGLATQEKESIVPKEERIQQVRLIFMLQMTDYVPKMLNYVLKMLNFAGNI